MFGLNNRNDAKERKGSWWQLLKLGFTPTTGKNKKGTHANAPNYDAQIKDAFRRFEEKYGSYTDEQAKSFLEDIRNQILNKIDANPNTKLNDLKLDLNINNY